MKLVAALIIIVLGMVGATIAAPTTEFKDDDGISFLIPSADPSTMLPVDPSSTRCKTDPSADPSARCTTNPPVEPSVHVPTLRQTDDECKSDSDCGSGACARASAAKNAPLVCCPSGSKHIYAFYYYCNDMPDTSTCWSNAMCADGSYCKGNADGVKRGTCTRTLDGGARCSRGEECIYGACIKGTCCGSAGFSTKTVCVNRECYDVKTCN